MQNNYSGKMSLRPFLESVKNSCENMTKEDLVDFVMYYAETVPVKGRIDFLDNIASFSNSGTIPEFDETIIDKISDLKDEIRTRYESIEDGSFYEESEWNYKYNYHNKYNNYYDDEEPDCFSDEQKEEMEEYFNQADAFFLSGELAEASSIYSGLYSIFNNDDSFYGPDESYIDIEHRETRARYLRCIYDTSNQTDRVKNLLAEINIHASLSDYHYKLYDGDDPLLVDIEDAKMEELPDKSDFLNDWIEILAEYETNRAHLLLLEATNMKEGINGVQRLARKWKDRQPRGYLFWINILINREEWNKVIDSAREALSVVPCNYLRGVIACEMINAGIKIQEDQIVLEGKRELFYSVPEEKNLIDLLKEAKKQNASNIEINSVLSYLGKYKEEKKDLEIKILMMKGALSEAFLKNNRADALGWSYSSKSVAILFAGVLSALIIKNIHEAEIIKLILKRYTEAGESYSFTAETYNDADLFMFNEILEGLKKISITDEQESQYFAWIEGLGKKRIESIVSNKHRKSYNKAAEILCGLAECFILLNKKQVGLNLIHEYRDEKYNRYPAFKRELQSILTRSNILRQL